MLFGYDDGPSMEKDFVYDVGWLHKNFTICFIYIYIYIYIYIMNLGYTFWQEMECLGEKRAPNQIV